MYEGLNPFLLFSLRKKTHAERSVSRRSLFEIIISASPSFHSLEEYSAGAGNRGNFLVKSIAEATPRLAIGLLPAKFSVRLKLFPKLWLTKSGELGKTRVHGCGTGKAAKRRKSGLIHRGSCR